MNVHSTYDCHGVCTCEISSSKVPPRAALAAITARAP